MGWPPVYTDEIADRVIELIENGMTIRRAGAEIGISQQIISFWIKNRPGFRERYMKAIEIRADYWAEEIVDIADDAANDYTEVVCRDGSIRNVPNLEHIARSRLRIDTRWRIMACINQRYNTNKSPEPPAALPQPIHISIDGKDYGSPKLPEPPGG